MRKTFLGAVISIACLIGAILSPVTANAATASDFNPGNIISDAVFYDSAALTESQIQSFLDSKVTNCRSGYTCLENYRQTTSNQSADAKCSAYTGKTNQLASSIIYDVSRSCGINPQVLIVLLEKEQGLISDTWPDSSQYKSATGYGCPDTAACDSDYYGFFNQVYNAAHQFKNYRLNPSSFRYRAGQSNTIQWHPNAGCGASQVFIENQATAGLYNYTPYRPNTAALGNMYGTGDGCSSYGNRNFWRTFTDWFGDPTGGYSLVGSRTDGKVYVVYGLTRYHIPSPEVLTRYRALMPIKWVDESYFTGFTSGASAGDLIRDPSNGDIFLLSDGGRSRFPNCSLVAAYGYNCSATIDLSPAVLNKFPLKPEVTPFARAEGKPEVYLLDSGQKRWVTSPDTLFRLNGGSWPYVTITSASFIVSKTDGPSLLGPGRLYKNPDSPQIYLVDGLNSKIPVSSFDTTVSLGIGTGWVQVDSAALNSYTTSAAALTNTVSCLGATYVGASGRLAKLGDPSTTGGISTTLSDMTCSNFPRDNTDVGASLMVRDPGKPEVYLVANGLRHHILSGSVLASFFPSGNVRVLSVSSAAQNEWPLGSDVSLGVAKLYKDTDSPRIFLVDGLDKKIYLSSYDIATNLGINGYTVTSVSELSAYQEVTGSLQNVVQCGAQSYIGDGGSLTSLGSAGTSGLISSTLSSITCSALPKSGNTIGTVLLMKQKNTPEVYSIENGVKRWVTSGATLASLTDNPVIVSSPGSVMTSLSTGTPISIPIGALARNPASGQIFLVNSTSSKTYLTSWDVLADLGLSMNWSNFPSADIDSYTSTTSSLQPIVRCGQTTLLGSQGVAYPIASSLGFDNTASILPNSSCRTLKRGNQLGSTVFVKSPTGPEIYVLSGGQKHHVPSMARLSALNGGSVPAMSDIIILKAASLACLPEGAQA